jgi:hypothetical protein
MATLAANSASRCDGHRVADEQPLARRSNASTARLCSRVCLVVVIVLAMCLSVDAAKQKKVKTTFKALKCSACKAVAEEIKQEVKHEWDSRAGDTILIGKRKKNTKVSYVESSSGHLLLLQLKAAGPPGLLHAGDARRRVVLTS